MTFRDVVLEAENYEFSQEAFDIFKECSEIAVMQRYLDNQRFAEDVEISSIESDDDDDTFTEGFLMESVSDDQIALLEAKVAEKSGNVFKRIGAGIKKCFHNIINFFKRLIPIFDGYHKKTEKLKKYFNKNTAYSKSFILDVCQTVNKAADDSGFDKFIGVSTSKNNAKNVSRAFRLAALRYLKEKGFTPNELNGNTPEGCLALVNAALEDNAIYVDETKYVDEHIMDPSDLKEICRYVSKLSKGKVNYRKADSDKGAVFMGIHKDSKEHPITVNSAQLEKDINELQKAYDDIEDLLTTNFTGEAAANIEQNPEALRKTLEEINKTIAGSIKAYTAVNQFKNKALTELANVIQSHKDDDPNDEMNAKEDVGQELKDYDKEKKQKAKDDRAAQKKQEKKDKAIDKYNRKVAAANAKKGPDDDLEDFNNGLDPNGKAYKANPKKVKEAKKGKAEEDKDDEE